MPAVTKVNEGMLKRLGSRERIKLVDCSQDFVGNPEVDEQLMPDKLHPNAAGHEKLAVCIGRHVP